MKLVEGQLEYLIFLRDFSGVSHSIATQILRDFVRVVELSQEIIRDVMPRWIEVEPMIDENGRVSGDWIHPLDNTGRIVRGSG